MRKDEVPQDAGLFGDWHEINYALDNDGRYVQVKSAGWSVSNIANLQAWDEYFETVEEAKAKVKRGEASPIAFYMAVNQMDTRLLAKYMHISGWRVKRHLNPARFNRLSPGLLDHYSQVFRISIEELREIPDAPLSKADFLGATTGIHNNED